MLAALVVHFETVLLPFGDNHRFDMAFLGVDDVLHRVQVKNGRLRNGVVIFSTVSSTLHHRGGKRTGYTGQIEFFGVYCAEVEKCYLVPVELFGESAGSLRVDSPQNNQVKRIIWAKDYELPL